VFGLSLVIDGMKEMMGAGIAQRNF